MCNSGPITERFAHSCEVFSKAAINPFLESVYIILRRKISASE